MGSLIIQYRSTFSFDSTQVGQLESSLSLNVAMVYYENQTICLVRDGKLEMQLTLWLVYLLFN